MVRRPGGAGAMWALVVLLAWASEQAVAAEAVVVGRPPPALVLRDLRGAEVGLEALVGKVVIIDFWASWCAPCMVELPLLNAMLEAHEGEGLVVLAVNVDSDAALRDRYLERHPLRLVVLDDSAHQAAARYQIDAMPTTVLVDRQGKVAAVHQGFTKASFAALRAETEQAL